MDHSVLMLEAVWEYESVGSLLLVFPVGSPSLESVQEDRSLGASVGFPSLGSVQGSMWSHCPGVDDADKDEEFIKLLYRCRSL